MVVQLELWDAQALVGDLGWPVSAWNPDNNVNYTYAQTQLVDSGNWLNRQFFEAIPSLNDDTLVYAYQSAYIDRLLSYAAGYNHVLYQIDNETTLPHAITSHWADYVHARVPPPVFVADARRYHPPTYLSTDFMDLAHTDNFFPVNTQKSFTFL
jgi:hypothetical protein